MDKMLGKVFLLVVVSLFIFSSGAFAAPVSMQMAEDVARTHLRANNERERLAALTARKAFDKRSISTPDIIELQDNQTGETLAYVLGLSPEGFIVVSPDTDITPIIAYSFKGNFPLKDFQDNVLLHMVTWDMESRLEAIPTVSGAFKETNNDLWEEYLSTESSFLETLVRASPYGPYLDTQYSQESPYNAFCPYDPYYYYYQGRSIRCPVGCVATAMAQIINYHQYPSSVTFTSDDNYWYWYEQDVLWYWFSSLPPYFDPASASISSITYPASNNSYMAARLSYTCGVSVGMKYKATGSGISSHSVVASAFKNKFNYYSASYYVNNSANYSLNSSDFYSKLESNMQTAQPTILGIQKTGAGHSIVCDGYNSTTGQYHLNYGWGTDGQSGTPSTWWYTLPSGMPSDYNIVSEGVLDIKPPVYVDPSGFCNGNTPCYTTIQSAIDAASSGAVIKILAGTYAENLDLNSSNNHELQGGWNAAYSSQTSTSSVTSMTFGSSSGTVTVGNIVIQ